MKTVAVLGASAFTPALPLRLAEEATGPFELRLHDEDGAALDLVGRAAAQFAENGIRVRTVEDLDRALDRADVVVDATRGADLAALDHDERLPLLPGWNGDPDSGAAALAAAVRAAAAVSEVARRVPQSVVLLRTGRPASLAVALYAAAGRRAFGIRGALEPVSTDGDDSPVGGPSRATTRARELFALSSRIFDAIEAQRWREVRGALASASAPRETALLAPLLLDLLAEGGEARPLLSVRGEVAAGRVPDAVVEERWRPVEGGTLRRVGPAMPSDEADPTDARFERLAVAAALDPTRANLVAALEAATGVAERRTADRLVPLVLRKIPRWNPLARTGGPGPRRR